MAGNRHRAYLRTPVAMADKSTVYLESTIFSYLAARPSRDLIVASHQQITNDWWQESRQHFDLYVSQAVLDEIGVGDPDASRRRLELAAGWPVLAMTEEVGTLAQTYSENLGLPPRAWLDVVHLACACVYEVEYLLTWNCAHLANGVIIQRLQVLNLSLGRMTPIIVTPEELLPFPGGD